MATFLGIAGGRCVALGRAEGVGLGGVGGEEGVWRLVGVRERVWRG